jgi:hypothetical protein
MRNLEPANNAAWRPSPFGRQLAVREQTSRSLRRALALAPAWHLDQASALLNPNPSVDALMLAAIRMPGVVAEIGLEAWQLGAPVPADVIDAMPKLRHWAATLKEQVRGGRA